MVEGLLDPGYWVSNLTSPVRFSTAISNMLNAPCTGVLLEIGPHGTLASALREICAANDRPFVYASAMNRGQDSHGSFLSAVGQLYQQGIHFDLRPLFNGSTATPGLPLYAWDHGPSYRNETRLSKAWRTRQNPHHSLLGALVLEAGIEPIWRNILHIQDQPWLADHVVNGSIVFPFAAYVAMAGEAVRQHVGAPQGTGYRLQHSVARNALVLSETTPVEMVTSLRRRKLNDTQDSFNFDFSISSYNGTTWITHCEGQARIVEISDNAVSNLTSSKNFPRLVDVPRMYSGLAKVGYGFGPQFRCLEYIAASAIGEGATASIRNGSTTAPCESPFTQHPTTIDACLQLLLIAEAKGLVRQDRKSTRLNSSHSS